MFQLNIVRDVIGKENSKKISKVIIVVLNVVGEIQKIGKIYKINNEYLIYEHKD